jgi:hypothetical protein
MRLSCVQAHKLTPSQRDDWAVRAHALMFRASAFGPQQHCITAHSCGESRWKCLALGHSWPQDDSDSMGTCSVPGPVARCMTGNRMCCGYWVCDWGSTHGVCLSRITPWTNVRMAGAFKIRGRTFIAAEALCVRAFILPCEGECSICDAVF